MTRTAEHTETLREHVHEFVGRLDRWCEVCDRPDRHPIHTTLRVLAERARIRREPRPP